MKRQTDDCGGVGGDDDYVLVGFHYNMQKVFELRFSQVNMFLSKLTGTTIGLTAWDMFVLNKPALLTVSQPLVSSESSSQ